MLSAFDRLFGLSESEIHPVLEGVVNGPVADFTAAGSAVDGGYSGSDCRLVRFEYRTPTGKTGQTTLFVKRCVWKGRSEAVHYRHLAANGVPTPRLYGALNNGDGEEILFLEALHRTGFRMESEKEWRDMLSLMARFNACPAPPEYRAQLHQYEQVGRVSGKWWITGIHSRPWEEELRANLNDCGTATEEIPTLLESARALFDGIDQQPKGLLHQDFLPDNLGWRGDEMVVFDLHKNSLGPRFADVAPYLGLPDWSDSAAFLDHPAIGSLRDTLIQHYLDEYVRFGGEPVSREAFRQETTALARAHKVSVLSWLVEQGMNDRTREALNFLRQHPP